FISTNSFISVLLGNGDGTFQPHQEFLAGNSPSLYSLAVADFNDDGKPDVVVTQPDANSLSLLLGNGDGTFQTFVKIPAGLDPYTLVVGDFNLDGKADVACTNVSDNSVSVFLGKGNGTFQLRIDFAAGQEPTFLSAADLDLDGKLDLTVSDNGYGGRHSTLSLLFGLGNGGLAAAGVYDTGTQGPSRLASGDFNGDGVADLVANSSFGNLFSLILGKGDGTFDSAQTTNLGLVPTAIAVGDLNHDGKLDVIIGGNGPNGGTVSILLGNGNGTFQPRVDLLLASFPLWVDNGVFNRDGTLDVGAAVLSAQGGSDVSVLLGNGDGTLQPPAVYGFGGRAGQLLAADVDGDGRLDLVLAHNSFLSVLPGRGDGTFRLAVTTPCPGNVFSVGVGDFNEDGKLDAVISVENSNAILLGNGNGTFQPPAARYSPGGGFISIVDLNRDGHLDLVSGVTSRLGNGDGTLRTAQHIASGSEIAIDFNGDGYQDVANSNTNVPSGWGHTITVELNKGTQESNADY